MYQSKTKAEDICLVAHNNRGPTVLVGQISRGAER